MDKPANQIIKIVPFEQYQIEKKCFDIGRKIIGYDQGAVLPFAELFPNGKPIRFGIVYDETIKAKRPDWEQVTALTRQWELSTRANLQTMVRRYQAGDHSVLPKIEDDVRALAYDTVNKFAFETDFDKKVFVDLSGRFVKKMPKKAADGDRRLFVRFVPFKFDEDTIEEQITATAEAALKTYDPNKKTMFSTWFVRRLKLDLLNLYKQYKGKPEKIKDRAEFENKKLWSKTFISVPRQTDIPIPGLTFKQMRWISLVLESLPYNLSVTLRSELLGIDPDTDKNIRDGLKEKLQAYIDKVPGEFNLYRKPDRFMGYIILDPSLHSLMAKKCHPDPTFVTVARILDGTVESPKPPGFIPAPAYNWYRDKAGLNVMPGSNGVLIIDRLIPKIEDWLKELEGRKRPKLKQPVRKYYVYNHTKKVYCKMLTTRSDLIGYLAIKDAAVGARYISRGKSYKLCKFSDLF